MKIKDGYKKNTYHQVYATYSDSKYTNAKSALIELYSPGAVLGRIILQNNKEDIENEKIIILKKIIEDKKYYWVNIVNNSRYKIACCCYEN
jgi:hypothetical protein